MSSRSRKNAYIIVLLGCVLLWMGPSSVGAANISEFINIKPYAEIEGVYDDNVFEVAEDAALPEDAEEREDVYLNARAGVGVDVTFERPYLSLGLDLDYNLTYTKYMNNTEYDGTENNLDFDVNFASKFEEQVERDRFTINLKDELSLIPIDEDEPLTPENGAIRNVFQFGAEYNLISTARMILGLGYSYSRTDYEENDPIEVPTVSEQYEDSADLTQESQSHQGKANFKFILNPRVSYTLTYTYDLTPREENAGEATSATFTRQRVLSGLDVKVTPKIQANAHGGYTMTTYDDVDGLSQNDQENVVAETSLTANFDRRPLIRIGYRRYYTENDFGDTLLTDTLFVEMGVKIIKGLILNFSGDYIVEDRDLVGDETTRLLFGVDTEYSLLKNLTLLAGYQYKNKEFFENNFVIEGDREETTHTFSGGMQYKISRYVLMKGMYYYTDKSSNLETQEFTQNKFVAGGKVVF